MVPALGRIFDAPLASSPVDAYPSVDWQLLTTPQSQLNGKQYHYWRGRTLGGSSALNNMAYHRGTIGSYETWVNSTGDESWSFDDFLPYFTNSTHFSPSDATGKRPANASAPLPARKDAYSEHGGPLQVSYTNYPLPASSWLAIAMNESGIPEQNDFLSGELLGWQYTPQAYDADTQTRSSSYASFLNASVSSETSSLVIYPHAIAERILFNENKTAIGATLSSRFGGRPFNLTARKEVIVSMGTFQSPQILMLSGIGPAATLQSFNITVLSDLSGVGANMMDHVHVNHVTKINLDGLGALNNATVAAARAQEYIANATGPYCSAGFDFIGWGKIPEQYRSNFTDATRSALASIPDDWPEIELIVTDVNRDPTKADSYVGLAAAVAHPFSRGNVTIVSDDIRDLPLVNPNWLSNETDLEMAVAAYRWVEDILAQDSIQTIFEGERVSPPPIVGSDDAAIRDFIRNNVNLIYHAAGTCIMGRSDDPMAVQNLRVVDASSFILPPGHPIATICESDMSNKAEGLLT